LETVSKALIVESLKGSKLNFFQTMNVSTILQRCSTIRHKDLTSVLWSGEARTQTDLVFLCRDGSAKAHKLLLKGFCRVIEEALDEGLFVL
jgi:hypothetical protein